MSKKNVNVPAESLNMYENEPFIFRRWMIGNIEGRLLTLIESFGFETKREEAVKSVVRNELWNWFRDNTFPIPDREKANFEELVNRVYTNPISTDLQGRPIK